MSGPRTPEGEVSAALVKFLRGRGWRPLRWQRTTIPGAFSTGEPGIPDLLFLHRLGNGISVELWIEVKRPGYKARCNCKTVETPRGKARMHVCRSCTQAAWAERERLAGAVVMRVDDVAAFVRWYDVTYAWIGSRA